jgi:hypothetical protein
MNVIFGVRIKISFCRQVLTAARYGGGRLGSSTFAVSILLKVFS